MSTYPTTPIPTTHVSSGTNTGDPALARIDFLALINAVNQMMAALGQPNGIPFIDANGQTVFGTNFLAGLISGNARITMGSDAYIEYNRTTKTLDYYYNGTKTASVPFATPLDYSIITNAPVIDNSACDTILSLISNDPWMLHDTTGATNVYVIPFGGNRISLWDDVAEVWRTINFTTTSISLAGKAANTIWSIYAYLSSGSMALEMVQWIDYQTNDPMTISDGVAIKSGDKTRRYLGAVAIDTTGTSAWVTNNGQHGGTPAASGGKTAKMLLYSYYKRRRVALYSSNSTSSWNYGTNTWRAAGGATGHYHKILFGDPWGWAVDGRTLFKQRYICECWISGNSGLQKAAIGIGVQLPDGSGGGPYIVGPQYGHNPGVAGENGNNTGAGFTLMASNEDYPWVGLRRYFPMEKAPASTAEQVTFYGSGNSLGTDGNGNIFISEIFA